MSTKINTHVLLLTLCILLFCIPGHGVLAFGAGNIPRYVPRSPYDLQVTATDLTFITKFRVLRRKSVSTWRYSEYLDDIPHNGDN